MSDARWQRIEEVFHRAADLAPVQRAEFLSTACAGDDELRREVESLLANDDSEDNLVEAAVSKAVDTLPDEQAAAGDDLVGKNIGPYLVTELIGKGGMGMVYKARDTQLNRSVAIKALPSERLTDPERKRRFFTEAKATSALNHPNIVTVHGITHEHGTDFIVMEYVVGKTLDQLIPNKGLPLKQAVKYGLAIADAVSAAHLAGIIHRDIKPSNIMIAEQGRVKVLDFGLAKLAEPDQPAEKGSTEPLSTKAGMILGTAGYMSPEQAEGKPADARSDIFSFGALLYQMVTGRRAFPGDNVITILAAVINQEPAALAKIVPNAPRELEWVITRCLKKDPDHRIQHMADVKIALEEALERMELPSPLPVVQPRRRWIAPALIALVLALVAGAWLSRRIFRTEPITFQRLTFRHGDVLTAKFAPNGTVVYAAEWDGSPPTLYSAQPGTREARDLQLPAGNIQAVSTSGELAILIGGGDFGASGTLARVPLAGGAPRAILENVWYADWGPPGANSIAVVRTLEGYYRVEYPVGTVLYQTQALRTPLYVRVAPRGDLVAFFDYTNNGDYSLNVVDANRNRRALSRGWRTVAGGNWSPDGKEIWFGGGRPGTDEALWAVDLSGRERLLTQIAGHGFLHDVGRDGRVLLANVDSRIGIRCFAPGAVEERDLAWLDASLVWDISNDGSEVLFEELSSGEGRNPAIYLRRADGSPAVLLGYGTRPALSPNREWVACVRRDHDTSRLVLLPSGAGQERILSTGSVQTERVEWFPDGKRLLFSGNEPNQPPRSYSLDLNGEEVRPVTSPGMRASAISPDGQFVAMISEGRLSLHSFVTGRDSAVGAVEPGVSIIRWSGDRRYLFLQRVQGNLRSATILRMDVRSGHQEIWRDLKLVDPAALFFGLARISADGKSYAYSFQRDLATLYLVKGVK
ncbi:MAG TPA: protein kinase [Bryobacteraceae bacterium]|nr:protein kinase [Bryobacteraceae bacterium]